MSNDSELLTERWLGLNERETPADTEHLLEGERDEDSKDGERDGEVREREESSPREDEGESKGEERHIVEEHDQTRERESEVKGQERVVESREEVEGGVKERVRHIHEEDKEERGSVEHSIQVLDGHIALGSVQWKECRTKAAAIVQVKSTENPACSWSDKLALV